MTLAQSYKIAVATAVKLEELQLQAQLLGYSPDEIKERARLLTQVSGLDVNEVYYTLKRDMALGRFK